METNNDEKIHFTDVGKDDAAKDGLFGLIGTLKQHTKQFGVDLDGDNVAIGEITGDEDNKIK